MYDSTVLYSGVCKKQTFQPLTARAVSCVPENNVERTIRQCFAQNLVKIFRVLQDTMCKHYFKFKTLENAQRKSILCSTILSTRSTIGDILKLAKKTIYNLLRVTITLNRHW